MEHENTNKKVQTEKKVVEGFKWKIPDCCRLGLPSCPHVVNRPKKTKKNVGL